MNYVAITGMGVVSPYGYGVSNLTVNINSKKPVTLTPVTLQITDYHSVTLPTGLVTQNFIVPNTINEKLIRMAPKRTMFALAAALEAVEQAKLTTTDLQLSQLYLSSTLTSFPELKRVSSIFESLHHNPAFIVAEQLGIERKVVCPVASCASGLQSIALGYEAIRSGETSIAICGGTEEWSEELAKIFVKLGIASKTTCKPFATDRDGTIISEGAGIVVLENTKKVFERGITPIAYITNVGHSFSPNPSTCTTKSIHAAMSQALIHSNMTAKTATFAICPHATGTIAGDEAEEIAIRLFNFFIKTILPYKQLLGHTMGASGAIETIASIVDKTFTEENILKTSAGLGGNVTSIFITRM